MFALRSSLCLLNNYCPQTPGGVNILLAILHVVLFKQKKQL